jgi:hypothetical protein
MSTNTPDEPITDIRTDLWGTMNSSQLSAQRDLIITKIALLQSMGTQNPSIRGLMVALHTALNDINSLIVPMGHL